jgi:hypothetical protein
LEDPKRRLNSFLTNLPRTEILGAALKSRLQICPSHVSELLNSSKLHNLIKQQALP